MLQEFIEEYWEDVFKDEFTGDVERLLADPSIRTLFEECQQEDSDGLNDFLNERPENQDTLLCVYLYLSRVG